MKKQLVIIAMLLGFAAVSYSQDCPPKPETWPSVKTSLPDMWWTPFVPRFHGDDRQTRLGGTFERRCNMNSETLDMGALICKDGKWEVYGMGPYNPNDQSQKFWVNLYGRYGCGPSGGHGHGIDAYVYPSGDYELATGKPLVFGSIEHIDTWYHPTLYKWISAEARKKEGPPPLCPNRVCDPGEDSVSCPQDCPVEVETCVRSMPTDLWPKADFNISVRPEADAGLTDLGIPRPLDMGALRADSNGCVEVLWYDGNHSWWEPYNPLKHKVAASGFSRYGRGFSYGHTSEDGMSYRAHHFEVFGEHLEPGSMKDADYQYSRELRDNVFRLWKEKQTAVEPSCGNGKCEQGETSTSCLVDCPRQIIDNPNCNNICNEPDRVCDKNGKLVGGRCPSDCDPCPPVTKPPEPPVNAASCRPFTDPLNETIHGLETEIESLSKIPILPEYLSVLYREEKTRALSGKLGVCTRYNRYIPQLCAMYLCPSDLVRIMCKRSGV